MAEFDFYGTWEDSSLYLEKVVTLGRFTLVVDMPYEQPVVFQSKVLSEDLMTLLQQRPHLYLWSDEYSRFPAGFLPGRHYVTIDPHISGPALQLSLPICFPAEVNVRLGEGVLSYLPLYENPETGELYKPPEALKQAYNDVRRLLQKTMARCFVRCRVVSAGVIKPIVVPLWIGPNAMDLLEAGKAEIRVAGEWRMGKDLSRSRSELSLLVDEDE
jgi:hypothetical protein